MELEKKKNNTYTNEGLLLCLKKIVNDLQDLAQGIASIPELYDTVKDIDTIIKNVNDPLLVMVMGEFSTGKSSFINALVEKEIAIVNAKPTNIVYWQEA